MAVWMLDRTAKRKLARIIALVLISACIVYGALSFRPREVYAVRKDTMHIVYDPNQKEYTYDKSSPLIFIGGIPRSGTTLMRAMLDAHPDIRCGEETRLIPNMLQNHERWVNNLHEKARLLEAGIDDDVMNDALAAFMLEIMAKHGEPAKRLCNKDPFVLSFLSYLHGVFPNGKYLLMIRDGRATAHSIISRRVGIVGYNITSYRDCLSKWNRGIEKMYNQCLQEGPTVCLPVFYEQLILHPDEWMGKILEFLAVPWNDAVLHHEDAVGKPGGISLSKKERSTDQVIKPVNTGALTKWVGHIPADVLADIDTLAPMLIRLGYDTHAKYPKYGQQGDQEEIELKEDHLAILRELQLQQRKELQANNALVDEAKLA